MRKITEWRGFILTVCFLICLIMINAPLPVHGRAQEDDLKKQVETLTQKVDEQKQQLDSLKTDFEKFKAAVVERDKNTRQLITQHDQRLSGHEQTIGGLIQSVRQHDGGLRQFTQELTQQRNMIVNINNRLRAKGI